LGRLDVTQADKNALDIVIQIEKFARAMFLTILRCLELDPICEK